MRTNINSSEMCFKWKRDKKVPRCYSSTILFITESGKEEFPLNISVAFNKCNDIFCNNNSKQKIKFFFQTFLRLDLKYQTATLSDETS